MHEWETRQKDGHDIDNDMVDDGGGGGDKVVDEEGGGLLGPIDKVKGEETVMGEREQDLCVDGLPVCLDVPLWCHPP